MQSNEHKNRVMTVIVWFLPTSLELVLYFFLSLFTVFLSNLDVVREILFATGDFNPIRAAVDSITVLLERVVGERVAGSLSLGIFWGLVGLLVNAIWWVGSNFSTELNNDLVFSNYMHPKNYDPKAPLKEFISRSLFRAAIAILFVFYTNFVIREMLPHLTKRYHEILMNFSDDKNIVGLLLAIIGQTLMFHGFVVLTRLLLLRKQVFND